MPDHSCRVCYDCDSQFTLFNRRHHCRLCGRVFCAKCTSNWIPSPSNDPRPLREEWEKVRVCNYCFKQWEQGLVSSVHHGAQVANLHASSSLSTASFISFKSSGTADSSSITYVSVPPSCVLSPCKSSVTESSLDRQNVATVRGSCDPADTGVLDPSLNQYAFSATRFTRHLLLSVQFQPVNEKEIKPTIIMSFVVAWKVATFMSSFVFKCEWRLP